ncbi:MAG: hypothetical protein CBE49_002875 [Rickettsiales bacterium TMED289]|nr:MAG: hypothetical protein CBE49_002875 [Rickettsiales bacterium TMED289]
MILKGLNKYELFDSESFKGRDKSVELSLDILKKTKIIVINGIEGSGKSSFIESGILKRIMSGFPAKSGRDWSVCKFRPGISPINNLCRALSNSNTLYLNSKPKSSDFNQYKKTINEKGANGIIEVYKKSEIFNKKNLLIVIDQVEDLYNYSKVFDHEVSTEDNLLIDLIYSSVKNDYCSIYFIIGVQNNSLSKLNLYGKFSELLSLGQYNLPNLNIKEFYYSIRNDLNFEISEDLIPKIQHQISEHPFYLTNFQYLLNKYNNYNFSNQNLVTSEIYNNDGKLNKIICKDLEDFYEKQNKITKKNIGLLLRMIIHSDADNNKIYYQKSELVRKYLNISKEDLTKFIIKLNTDFGKIFDIIERDISGIKPINNYIINDQDIITLKYPKSLNWGFLKKIEKEENDIYTFFERFYSTIKENKELEIDEIDEGIKIIHKDYINENWSKKYKFDYNIIEEFLINKKNKYDLKKNILERKIKREARKKKILKYMWPLIFILCFIVISGGLYERSSYQKTLDKNYELEIENYGLKQDNDSILKRDSLLNRNLELKKDSMKSLSSELKKKDIEINIFEDSIRAEEKRIFNLKDSLFEEKKFFRELQKDLASRKDIINLNINISKNLSNVERLTKEIRLLSVEDKKDLIKMMSDGVKLYRDYTELNVEIQNIFDKIIEDITEKENAREGPISKRQKLLNMQTIEFMSKLDIISDESQIKTLNLFRKLGNNMATKYYGVNDITELTELNLLRNVKNSSTSLNKVLITDENRIFSYGDSNILYYSDNKNSEMKSLSFSEFRLDSEIKSIVSVNSDVLFAGLNNGEIWYLSLSESVKTKIYSGSRKKNKKPITNLIYGNQKLYSVDNNLLLEYDLNSRKLKEIKIKIKENDYFIDLAYDNKNFLYLNTNKGDIYEFDTRKIANNTTNVVNDVFKVLDKLLFNNAELINEKVNLSPSHTLIFESSTSKDLSFNDKVNHIEFAEYFYDLKKAVRNGLLEKKYLETVNNKGKIKDKLIFSTINGWIYVCEKENGSFYIKNRVIVDNSVITNLKFDKQSGYLFSSALDGTFTAFDTRMELFSEADHWTKSPIELDLAPKNAITDAHIFKSNKSILSNEGLETGTSKLTIADTEDSGISPIKRWYKDLSTLGKSSSTYLITSSKNGKLLHLSLSVDKIFKNIENRLIDNKN